MSTDNMTAAEFRTMRETMGLSGPWLAQYLGIGDRSLRDLEAEKAPIRDGLRDRMLALKDTFDNLVDALVDQIAADPVVEAVPPYLDYVDDAGRAWPSSWQRAAVARAVEQVPGARIVYPPQVSG